MRISNLVRIAPSGHKRALHSLLLQYISLCSKLKNIIPDPDILPYMDLSNKITGFHSLDDPHFVTNPWNKYFIQNSPAPDELFRLELVSAQYDDSILLYGLSNNQIQIFFNTIKKYLKFRPHILQKANNFIQNNFGEKVVGIHIRVTDSFFDRGRPNLPISFYEKLINEKLTNFDKILICTDTIGVIDRLKEKFGNKIISYNSSRLDINKEKIALHETIHNEYNIDYGEQVLVESLILSKCDTLIRQQSNITTFSFLINPKIKLHQFDLPLWQPWNYHCCTQNTIEHRIKHAYTHYYHPELQINDIEYYKNQYLSFHNQLKLENNEGDARSYIYNQQTIKLSKDYFYNK